MPDTLVVVLVGAFAGGFVSGMTGFGTGMTTLPIWLQVIPPLLAGPLVVVCSLVSQFQTLPAIWQAIDIKRCAPFIFGGLIGVPFGAYMLPYVSVQIFKMVLGALLVAYCGFALSGRLRFHVYGGGRAADALVGVGGGLLGGLAGLSGALPTIWAGLRGWGKDVRRGVFQAFNTSILTFALISQASAGLITVELGKLFLVALPGTIAGAWLGRHVYNVLDHVRFEKAVLILLFISGFMLLLSNA